MSSRSSRRGRGGSDRLLEVAAGSDDYQPLPVDPMYAPAPGPPKPVNNGGDGGAAGGSSDSPSKHPRLQSLDVFRGLTVVGMILADDAGVTYKHVLDHSPWNDPTMADFVFPFFMFIVGVAVALSYRSILSRDGTKLKATRKALVRFLKLFFIGLLSQATNYTPPENPDDALPGCQYWCYAFDLAHSRVPGILQRIGFGYLVASLAEIYLRPSEGGEGPDGQRGPFALYRMYWKQWALFFAVTGAYLGVTFGLDVPGCGRGHITPGCNAAREVDRYFLGYDHMYPTPTLVRGHWCSPCAPQPYGDCSLEQQEGFVPEPFCFIPFDPEGLLSGLSSVGSSLLGLAFGHALLHRQEHGERLREWAPLSLALLGAGVAVHFGFFPINKNLWSTSYVLAMAGAAGLSFSFFYWLVDVARVQAPLQPLRWVGLNTIFVFTMAATGVFDTFLALFYWRTPGNDLVSQVRDHFFVRFLGLGFSAGVMCFVWLKIAFWCAVSGVMYRKRIFFKV